MSNPLAKKGEHDVGLNSAEKNVQALPLPCAYVERYL